MMSSDKNHISLFDELIRVLNLKNHTHGEIIADEMPVVDIVYKPNSEKSRKVINELITNQNKINRRKTFHTIFYATLAFIILFLSSLLWVQNFKKVEIQNENIPNKQQQIKSVTLDSVQLKSDTTIVSNNLHKKEKTNRLLGRKYTMFDTIKKIITDTIHQELYQRDTIIQKVLITDTIYNYSESEAVDNTPCVLPKKYTFQFEKKSLRIDEKHENYFSELAYNVKNCSNLYEIEIKGYYSQKFIFFTNKKLVNERFENIKKEFKRCDIASQTLSNFKYSLIKTSKSEQPDHSQLVEIILKN